MIRNRLLPAAAIALAALSLGAGCPTIPKIEDRVVELAAAGSTTETFVAAGVINVYNQAVTFNLSDELDLRAILDDAGIDVENVKNVKLTGVSYRVVVPDLNAGRAIQNGNVTVQRGSGAVKPLVTDFNANASSVTSWTTAPLDTAGVNLLNVLLEDILTSIKNGTTFPDLVSTRVSGASVPVDATTNFTWELRLDVSIVGTVEISVLN